MKKPLALGLSAFGLLFLLTPGPASAGNVGQREHALPAPAVAHGQAVARAKQPPALAAPVISSCGSAAGDTTVAWGAVTSATKYSVEYVVGYDVATDDGCADAFLEFDYGTKDTTLAVPLTDFDHNFCDEVTPCVESPVSITVRVKGLNPPSGGPRGSGAPQNNPFSALCVILADTCQAQ